jgi:hypothetical protein
MDNEIADKEKIKKLRMALKGLLAHHRVSKLYKSGISDTLLDRVEECKRVLEETK